MYLLYFAGERGKDSSTLLYRYFCADVQTCLNTGKAYAQIRSADR